MNVIRKLNQRHDGSGIILIITCHQSVELKFDSELVASSLEILCREGLLVRLTTGGFSNGNGGAILADGNPSLDSSFFHDYPVRICEAESRLASIRAFAGLAGDHGEFLDHYFRGASEHV